MLIDKLWNFIMLKRKGVNVGSSLKINGRIYIHGRKNSIRIGNDYTIQSAHYVNPTSGNNHTHINASYGGTIMIGNHVGISHSNITSYSSVVIEDNVLIGSGVKIWDTDFHSIEYEKRMKHPDPDVKSAPIRICEGAFIGACSIILKGVTVGKHAIIGAGSVVTKDVPEDEIWAGNPARRIGGGNLICFIYYKTDENYLRLWIQLLEGFNIILLFLSLRGVVFVSVSNNNYLCSRLSTL